MKKKEKEDRAGTITPEDVQAKEFRVARFGGYKMHDVDEFLDQVTVALQEATSRANAGVSNAVIGAPDLAEVARQADEIIRRAREEASRILAGAEARSAHEAAQPDKDMIGPYLERERRFLESIAGLVQEHAESIKSMVRSDATGRPEAQRSGRVRVPPAEGSTGEDEPAPPVAGVGTGVHRHADAPSGSATRASAAEPAPAMVIPAAPGEIAAAMGNERGERPSHGSKTSEGKAIDHDRTSPEPLAIPAYKPTGSGHPAQPAGAERSLRDLFWGED